MQGQGAGTPAWSVASHWVLSLWGFLGDADQGQPPAVFCPGTPAWPIKQSEMAATCSGLGDSQAKPSYESRLAAINVGPGTH